VLTNICRAEISVADKLASDDEVCHVATHMDEQRQLPPSEHMMHEFGAISESTTLCHDQAPAQNDAGHSSASMAIHSPQPLSAGDTNASPTKTSDALIKVLTRY
jgi:hypothetical protein